MFETGVLEPGTRTELSDGIVFAVAPFSPPHIAVVNCLDKALVLLAGDEARVGVQNSVRLDDGTEPEPDLALLRPGAPEDCVPVPDDVLLVVEVAVTTEALDRNVKLRCYTEAALHTKADTVNVLGASLAAADVFPPPTA